MLSPYPGRGGGADLKDAARAKGLGRARLGCRGNWHRDCQQERKAKKHGAPDGIEFGLTIESQQQRFKIVLYVGYALLTVFPEPELTLSA